MMQFVKKGKKYLNFMKKRSMVPHDISPCLLSAVNTSEIRFTENKVVSLNACESSERKSLLPRGSPFLPNQAHTSPWGCSLWLGRGERPLLSWPVPETKLSHLPREVCAWAHTEFSSLCSSHSNAQLCPQVWDCSALNKLASRTCPWWCWARISVLGCALHPPLHIT